MSGCSGLQVHILGTGAPLVLEMDPHLEVAPTLLGMGDTLVFRMDPPL